MRSGEKSPVSEMRFMNSMFTSAEMRFLHRAVSLGDEGTTPEGALNIISEGMIDWDDLYKRADFHRIKPQVSLMLSRLPLGIVPEEIRERFNEAHKENIYQQLRNAGEFLRVKEELDRKGIQAIPFKGFWLAHDVYGSLGDRESSDIDLFIDIKDLERIESIMKRSGFALQDTLTRLTKEYILGELAEYNFNNYSGGERISHFEYHYRMGLRSYRMDIRMEDLRSQIINSTIQNRELKVFSPAANLLLAIMHHGGKDQFIKLKDILDIALIIKKHKTIDWEWLLNTAERFKVKNLVFLGVRLASVITGVKIPPEISEEVDKASLSSLEKGRIKRMALPVSKWYTFIDELKGWLFKIRSRDGLRTKLHLTYYTIRKILLPRLIPQGMRPWFFNKSIRVEPEHEII